MPHPVTTDSYARPLGSQYLVQLTEAAKQSEGGVWLPDNWVANWTDGLVLEVGPGMGFERPFTANSDINAATAEYDGWLRTKMWARPGDRVLFQRHDYRPWGEGYKEGTVRQEHVIAVARAPDYETLKPLNDWLLIEQFPDIREAGIILLAEEYRPKPMRGRIVDWGPGKLKTTGDKDYYGLLQAVSDLMNVPAQKLPGMVVYWPASCEVLAVGRSNLEYVLIHAEDLFGYDDDD